MSTQFMLSGEAVVAASQAAETWRQAAEPTDPTAAALEVEQLIVGIVQAALDAEGCWAEVNRDNDTIRLVSPWKPLTLETSEQAGA
jgi:hypothetical protein